MAIKQQRKGHSIQSFCSVMIMNGITHVFNLRVGQCVLAVRGTWVAITEIKTRHPLTWSVEREHFKPVD